MEIKGTNLIVHIREIYISEIAKLEDKPYNIIATKDEKEYNLYAIFRVLSYRREFLAHYIKKLPDNHLSKNNFEKVEYLSDEEYINIANAIKEQIAEIMSIYYDESLYSFGKLIKSEEDAETYIEKILEDKTKDFLY